MKHLVLAFVLVIATACGGGGPAPETQSQQPDPQPTPQEIVEAILNDCVAINLGELLDLLTLFTELQDPNTPQPAFNITPNILDGSVAWDIDTDNDTVSDVFGVFRLLDPTGTPYTPLQLLVLFGGVPDFTDFVGILADLPDGAQLVSSFNRPGNPLMVGAVSLRVAGGVPDTASGSVSVTDSITDCNSAFSFIDLPAAAVLADYPTGVFDMNVSTPENGVDGDITFNGTPDATMSLSLDGGTPLQFNVNLDTQVITPVP